MFVFNKTRLAGQKTVSRTKNDIAGHIVYTVCHPVID